MSFVSDAEYRDFLSQRIETISNTAARDHVRKKFEDWRQQYRCHRLLERACELLVSEPTRPSMLYLSSTIDLELMELLVQCHKFEEPLFRGFLIAESLWNRIEPQWFAPFRVYRSGQWRDSENTVVYSLSDAKAFRTDSDDKGNDYLDRFIDTARFSTLDEIQRAISGQKSVVYVDYRKVQTLAALSEQIRKQSDLATVLLVNSAAACPGGEFDFVFEEPFHYLWPLAFEHVTPDIFHLNVGWGTQGLPFTPFLPDETVIDFYDLLTFVEDESLKKGHPEPLEVTRGSEEALFSRFKFFVHRCSDEISDALAQAYPNRHIVSVTEYLREPAYEPQPSGKGDSIRLVYGGLLVQNGANENDPHYKNFLQMVKYYGGEGLELYLYPSPYLYGFGPAKGAADLARRLGVDNVHTCSPLGENDFVREIAQYDFGMCLPTPEHIRPTSYGYILPSKFIAYLRAGLPIVVPEDQTFIADLVRDNEIGVVYGYDDYKRMPELLKSQDINRLKRNVVKFRERFKIDCACDKILGLYNAALGGQTPTDEVSETRGDVTVRAACSCAAIIEKLDQNGFLSVTEYTEFLQSEVSRALSGDALQYVQNKLQGWHDAYSIFRCLSRLVELVAELNGSPYRIYLDGPACVNLLPHLLQGLTDAGLTPPTGFIVTEDLRPHMAGLSSCPIHDVTETVPQDCTVIGFSGSPFPGQAANVVLNDYLQRFIDAGRFQVVRESCRANSGKDTVLYPMYREIHTVSAVSRFVGENDQGLQRIALSPNPLIHADFDTILTEPFFYLWPIIFRMIDPSLVHLNVGWGIQALSLSPFVPDRERTVIDFYEVLSFLPDAYFAKTHSSADEVRLGEAHFCKNYNRIVHLCSDEVSDKLAEKYNRDATIVSVTEYMEEPTYNTPSADDGKLRLVYGGCMLATTDPDDLYYKAFAKVAPYFTRDNLHLYVYNSPYVHGITENAGLKEVIRQLGLTNAHACSPLPLDDFVKEISRYDFGVTLLRPKDMEAAEYNYFMATKLLTYLRAGLPVVIDADNHFMANLVSRYNIGIVLQDHDLKNLSNILNGADLALLKRNVVKFREKFSIERGGAKVLNLYHQILGQNDRTTVLPVATSVPTRQEEPEPPVDFASVISSMAEADNRLYYRDQSCETLESLMSLARRHDPTVIVELGTLAGLSLRAWVAAAKRAKIFAVDLSFQTLRETTKMFPIDMSRVTLVEQDILKTDFTSMWTPQDRVIFFVDAHDLPNVPIMEHVLRTVVPSLPDGSLVVVDDLWHSPERLTSGNAKAFLGDRVRCEIDELQCLDAHFAPYHGGGSFMGFAEVIPLLNFVNKYRIKLQFDPDSKHVAFAWKRAYLQVRPASTQMDSSNTAKWCGSAVYNPLESVPVGPRVAGEMNRITEDYRRGKLPEAANRLLDLAQRNPSDEGLLHGLAVCLAKAGMLSKARDFLARHQGNLRHPRSQQLFNDLVRRIGPGASQQTTKPTVQSKGGDPITIFAMPKPFTGHNGLIQRNAIRSWARLEPKPEIILFGDEPGIKEMAQEVGARYISEVGRNEFGTPLVNKLFGAAQDCASNEIVAYINADMILFQDFVDGVGKIYAELPEFLLIGQRRDLVVLEEINFDDPQWQNWLLTEMKEHSILHAECGLDYFVFRRGMYREIPPFAIGRTAWDNWLVMAPNKAGVPVVDGTKYITAIHQDHDYGHVSGGRQEAWSGIEASRNRALVGGATDDSGRTSGTPWVLGGDGSLTEAPPRPTRYLTAAYQDERSAWLVQQAGRLMAAQKTDLAACKWEEVLGVLEALLALKHRGHPLSVQLDRQDLTRRYFTTCTQLALCYMQTGRREQVEAIYTRLLDNPNVSLPQAQRDEITQIRTQVTATDVAEKPSVRKSTPAPLLQAQLPEPVKDDSNAQALWNLERKRRAMPDGTRAKYTLALRLSDLFRRAGLIDKSQALKAEALAMVGSAEPSVAKSHTVANGRPKVSVITACHNGQKYLPECLDSILSQTFSDWELHLVDDGSTDGTRGIIESYTRRDPRIKAHYFDDSAGPYVRRNYAIQRAEAPFIVIQDADDIMCPEKLGRLYTAITLDDRLGVVGSFYHMFLDEFQGIEHAQGVPLAITHEQILGHYRQYGLCDFCWHGSAIIRKTLFEELGYYDENPFASDSIWLAKVAEYAHRSDDIILTNIPESLTLRRMHAESQTQILPTFDPRSRRYKFTRYRQRKLSEVAKKLDSDPHADIKAELRRSVTNDYVRKNGHLFKQWENQSLNEVVIDSFMENIVTEFSQGQFVQCIVTCGIVERLVDGVSVETPCYDLIRGLAFFGLGLYEKSRKYLQREYDAHRTVVARDFSRHYLDQVDTQWTASKRAEIIRQAVIESEGMAVSEMNLTSPLTLVCDGRRNQAVELSIVVECFDGPEQWQSCLSWFQEQTRTDFELIILIPSRLAAGTIPTSMTADSGFVLLSTASEAGLVRRRNAAIRHARGKYVAFLGAGMVPETDFVEKVLGAFSTDDIEGLRGKIVGPRGALESIRFDLGDRPLHAACDIDEMCVFRKETFERLGGFPETVFDRGAILLSYKVHCDDTGQGRAIGYCPDVVVRHASDTPVSRRLAVMDRLCFEQLERSGQIFGRDKTWAFAYLRFVASLHRQTGQPVEGEPFRQCLSNGMVFLERFPGTAVRWIEKALAYYPNSARANYRMGCVLANLGRASEAIPFLEKAIPSIEALLAPGRIDRGQPDFADYAFVQICFETACKVLARCYMKIRRPECVVKTYMRLLNNPHVEITRDRMAEISKVCDRLSRALNRVSDNSPMRGDSPRVPQHSAAYGNRPNDSVVLPCPGGIT